MSVGEIPGEFLQRERKSLLDFGARGNGTFDNSDAILRAIEWVCSSAGPRSIYIPAGDFLIDSDNVLHPDTAGVDPSFGIHFEGASQSYSILRLKSDGSNARYLYNSTSLPGWNRCTFDELWFRSDQTTPETDESDTNGFGLWATPESGGHDKGFVFKSCRFDNLGVPYSFTGTSNAESCNWYSCWFSGCGPGIWSNDQGLGHAFYSCHFWCSGDVFRIKAIGGSQGGGGGGFINVYGPDIIQENVDGDTDPHYTIRIDEAADFFRNFNIYGGRWEFRGVESRLLHWTGATGYSNAQVCIRDSDMSIAQSTGDVDGRRNFVTMGPSTRLLLDNVPLPDQWAVEFTNVNTNSIAGFATQPLIELNGCSIPQVLISGTNNDGSSTDATRGLTGRVTQSNGYGRMVGRNLNLRNPGPVERMAVDFDYGGQYAVRGEPGTQIKRVHLKTPGQGWPTRSSGVGASERTILLPENAQIVGLGIDRPASGSSGASEIGYQLTNDDKTKVWLSTGPGRADSLHRAVANQYTPGYTGILPINVASDLNTRRVRLSANVDTSFSHSTGTAWLDYI